MAKNPMMDALRRLKIQNGDVVVVASTAISKEGINELAERLGKMGKTDILVIALPKPEDIRVMNETEMNKFGWFRARNIVPLRHKIPDGDKQEQVRDEPTKKNLRER